MKRVVIVLTVGLIAGLLAGQPRAFAQRGQVEISSAPVRLERSPNG